MHRAGVRREVGACGQSAVQAPSVVVGDILVTAVLVLMLVALIAVATIAVRRRVVDDEDGGAPLHSDAAVERARAEAKAGGESFSPGA